MADCRNQKQVSFNVRRFDVFREIASDFYRLQSKKNTACSLSWWLSLRTRFVFTKFYKVALCQVKLWETTNYACRSVGAHCITWQRSWNQKKVEHNCISPHEGKSVWFIFKRLLVARCMNPRKISRLTVNTKDFTQTSFWISALTSERSLVTYVYLKIFTQRNSIAIEKWWTWFIIIVWVHMSVNFLDLSSKDYWLRLLIWTLRLNGILG